MLENKLNIVIGVLFAGQAKNLSTAIGVSNANVSRWRKGKSMTTDELTKFYNYGISIDWLFDSENNDLTQMFNQTENGQALKEKFYPKKKYITIPGGTEFTYQVHEPTVSGNPKKIKL